MQELKNKIGVMKADLQKQDVLKNVYKFCFDFSLQQNEKEKEKDLRLVIAKSFILK